MTKIKMMTPAPPPIQITLPSIGVSNKSIILLFGKLIRGDSKCHEEKPHRVVKLALAATRTPRV